VQTVEGKVKFTM